MRHAINVRLLKPWAPLLKLLFDENPTSLSILLSQVLIAISLQFIGLLSGWLAKCFVCVRWGSTYSCWYQILAGIRQGGILSPILFAVYIDPLITQLRNSGLGCTLHGDFYGCLVYADDVLLLTHTVYSMQIMLYICDKFAENFDIKFNSSNAYWQ